jgi:hypothetical protein
MKKNQGYNRRCPCSGELGISGSKMVTNSSRKNNSRGANETTAQQHAPRGAQFLSKTTEVGKQPLGLEFRV